MGGIGTTWRRNIAENFNRLSRVHQRYRRQTDGPIWEFFEGFFNMRFARQDIFHNLTHISEKKTVRISRENFTMDVSLFSTLDPVWISLGAGLRSPNALVYF